jgi:hypothetical protein
MCGGHDRHLDRNLVEFEKGGLQTPCDFGKIREIATPENRERD